MVLLAFSGAVPISAVQAFHAAAVYDVYDEHGSAFATSHASYDVYDEHGSAVASSHAGHHGLADELSRGEWQLRLAGRDGLHQRLLELLAEVQP